MSGGLYHHCVAGFELTDRTAFDSLLLVAGPAFLQSARLDVTNQLYSGSARYDATELLRSRLISYKKYFNPCGYREYSLVSGRRRDDHSVLQPLHLLRPHRPAVPVLRRGGLRAYPPHRTQALLSWRRLFGFTSSLSADYH
jgi:hypothetical protein